MNDRFRRTSEWRTMAAAVGVAVLASACRSGGTNQAPPGALPPAEPTPGYRITYWVRELDRVREEHIAVRRPYESRRMSVRDGVEVSGTLVNREGLWQRIPGPDGGWQLIDPGRRLAEADPRILEALVPLVDEGLASVEGTDRVGGHRCVVVRTAEPIGTPATKAPTQRDYTELCLHPTGIMLAERWVIGGRTVREREATRLALDPVFEDQDYEATPLAANAVVPGGKQALEVTDEILESLEVGFDPPSDIAADGAEAWLTRDPIGAVTGGSLRRFYRRGDDLASVEEHDSDATASPAGIAFATSLGDGFLASDLHHLTLQVAVQDGVTVVVRASTMALLSDLAKAMQRTSSVDEEARAA